MGFLFSIQLALIVPSRATSGDGCLNSFLNASLAHSVDSGQPHIQRLGNGLILITTSALEQNPCSGQGTRRCSSRSHQFLQPLLFLLSELYNVFDRHFPIPPHTIVPHFVLLRIHLTAPFNLSLTEH